MADDLEEYYSKEDIARLASTMDAMREHLHDLVEIAMPDDYITYPVFYVGLNEKNYLVGVFGIRVDT